MHQAWWLLMAFLLTSWYLRDRLRRRRLPPGPTGLPLVGNLPMLGTAPHLALHALSKTYGPIMYLRIGATQSIIVSSAEKVALFLRGADFTDRPPSEIFVCLSYGGRGFAFANYGPTWRYLRKLCVTHLLSTQKVTSFGYSRRQELQLLIRTLNEAAEARKPVNVSAALDELVINMACRMIMGRKFEAGDKDGDRFHALLTELADLIASFNLADHIRPLRVFDLQGLKRRMRKLREGFDAVLDKILDEHLERRKNKNKKKKEGEEEDFVDVMLEFMEKDRDNQADGVQFDRTTIKAVVMVSGDTKRQMFSHQI